MKFKAIRLFAVLASLCLVFLPVTTQAVTPISSNAAATSLSLTVNSSFSESCSPPTITFTYASGAATASGTISCTANWNTASTYAFLDVIAWLSGGATAALTGPSSIPSSQVFSSNNGGAAVACTQTTTLFGATNDACFIFSQTSPPAIGNRTDTFLLSMSGLGTLSAGTYTGTLNVEGDLQ